MPPDPLTEAIERAHRRAIAFGAPGYTDPATGLFVLTEAWLRARGHCCGNGCRHCPYPPETDDGPTPAGTVRS